MPWTSVYVPQVFDAVYAYYLAFDRLARQGKISSVNTVLFHRLIQCYSRGNIGSNALRSILVELIYIFSSLFFVFRRATLRQRYERWSLMS